MVSTLSLMFHTYFSHSDPGIPGLTVLHFIVPQRSCVFFACKRMMTHSTAIRTSLWWSGREPAVSLKYVCTLFYEVNTNLFCYFNGGREKLESTCLRGEPVGPDCLGQWQGSSTFANFKTWDEGVSFSLITCEVLVVPVSWEDEVTYAKCYKESLALHECCVGTGRPLYETPLLLFFFLPKSLLFDIFFWNSIVMNTLLS